MILPILILLMLNVVSVCVHYYHPWDDDAEPRLNEATASAASFGGGLVTLLLVLLGWVDAHTAKVSLLVISAGSFIGAGVLFHASPPILRTTRDARGKLQSVEAVPRPIFFAMVALAALAVGVRYGLR